MSKRSTHAGFSLFELVLAVALSVVLLGLIGTAINLYLKQVDSSRTRVEEAQLARSILAMIADDIRGAAVYQPQDTSSLAKLAAAGTPFDVDSIDDPSKKSGSGSSGSSGTSSGSSFGTGSTTSGSSGLSSGVGASSSTSSSSSTSGSSTEESDDVMPLGINGSVEQLYVDATRLPRREALFASVTGYANAEPPGVGGGGSGSATGAAAKAGVAPPTDLSTVSYFVRPGNRVASASIATTSLSPDAQAQAGGLVRQEIPRRLRVWAEQSGNSQVLESGKTLVAPEVVRVAFRYYNGSEVADEWDMKEDESLPVAVEVHIWLAPPNNPDGQYTSQLDAATLQNAREYNQTVFLPMAELAASGQGAGTSGASSSGSSSTSSSTSGTSSSGSTGGSTSSF